MLKKRLLCVLFVLVLLLTVGCGKEKVNNKKTSNNPKTQNTDVSDISEATTESDESTTSDPGKSFKTVKSIITREVATNKMSADFVSINDLDIGADGDYSVSVNKAIASGKSIYFDSGTYKFSKPIKLKNAQILGKSSTTTTLITASNQPLIEADGCFAIKDMTLYNSIATGTEKSGENVLIKLGSNGGVTKGSVISSINFGACGTAIYEAENAVGSVGLSVETIEFQKSYYAGVELLSKGRKNNRYSNLYIGTVGTRLSNSSYVGARFDGSEENLVVDQLNVEHYNAETSVIFNNQKNLDVSSIHIEGMSINKQGNGYVECNNTSGSIDNIVVYWSRVPYNNSCCLYLGDAKSSGEDLFIGAIQFKGVNDPASFHGSWPNRGINNNGFMVVNRKPSSKNEYRLTVDSYIWFSYQNDRERLASFPCNENDVTYIKKGDIRRYGTTTDRPTQRLCKGYSKYYDTTLDKLLLYTQNGWVPADMSKKQ